MIPPGFSRIYEVSVRFLLNDVDAPYHQLFAEDFAYVKGATISVNVIITDGVFPKKWQALGEGLTT